jgi:hypothetical protein
MALTLVKTPKPIRAVPGSAYDTQSQDSGQVDAQTARVAWLEAVQALARGAAQADHDAAIRATGRPVSQND